MALVVSVTAWLAGCASAPTGPGGAAAPRSPLSTDRDGPEANPPPDLARVPDAEPRLEPIRSGGPNKPYDVLGKSYVPITQDAPFTERGLASWYGRKFHGRRTASGEVYNMYAMTAAHPTLPIPSYARIRNPSNGREIVVRINDRGPFHSTRIVDLSYTAALKLDLLRGVAPVELQRITFDEIRTGAWRRGREGDAVLAGEALRGAPATTATIAPASSTPPAAVPTGAAVASTVASIATPPSTDPGEPGGPPPVAMSVSEATTAMTAGAARSAAAANAGTNPNVNANASATINAPATVTANANAAANTPLPPVADAPGARAFTVPARGFWVQLGAFRARDGAEGFQRRVAAELDWLSPLLAVFDDAPMYRLQAGPYPRRDEARSVAERVRGALQLVPVIVERR